MRWLGLVLLAAACSESGAHFTLSAPDGPQTASSFRVILATPDQIPNIANQRVTPGAMATQTVPYFLQRTATGAPEAIDHVDGLRIKLEADLTGIPDTAFIPFVLLYDEHGSIVGIGTYHAPGRTVPSPVLVIPDEIDKYVLDVEPVTQVDNMTEAAPGQVQVVDCQTVFTSGIAWRPLGGGEVRLLFPEPEKLDATARRLDLDCDGKVVSAESSGEDCDDTRPWFHAGAPETCDGFDTNCDGLQTTVTTCTPSVGGNTICADPSTGMGIALCDDRTGTTSTCQSDPACLCAAGASSPGCIRCALPWEMGTTAGTVIPCQPGVGSVTTLSLCSSNVPCTVEVIAVRGGWKADIATDLDTMTFGSKALNVTGRFYLRARRPEGPGVEIPGAKGQTTGQVDFAITPLNGTAHLLAVDLAIEGDAASVCQGNPTSMYCTP